MHFFPTYEWPLFSVVRIQIAELGNHAYLRNMKYEISFNVTNSDH